MKICIYANCQGDGVAHFIRQVHPSWDVRVHHNWQILMGETSEVDLMRDAADCDVFIYQPTDALKHGMLSTEEMVAQTVPRHARFISFAYQFNTGFFPIVKHGKWWTGDMVMNMARNGYGLATPFDNDGLIYDCARRFAENLAEQEDREKNCTVKMVPWILENYQSKHLFLLCNHPASELFVGLAGKILFELGPEMCGRMTYNTPNDANLPGYHAVHKAVKRELGLMYEPDRRGEDPDFFRVLMLELETTKGG